MAKENFAGPTRKDNADLERTLNRVADLFAKAVGRNQNQLEKNMAIIAERVDMMGFVMGGNATTKNPDNTLVEWIKRSNREISGMSRGFRNFSDSIEELNQRLKDIDIEQKVLRDKGVKQETHEAQRIMTRANQRERDKAAPGMLMRGLFASQRSPKWAQYLMNKIGVRSYETREAELKRHEALNVSAAQTKIDIAEAKKRKELTPEEKGLPEGVPTEAEAQTEKLMAKQLPAKTAKRLPTDIIAKPDILGIARQKGIKEGAGELGKKEDLTVFPGPKELGPSIEKEQAIGKEKEKKDKQTRSKSSNTTEEGVTIIAYSKKTELSLGKIICKSIKDCLIPGLKSLFKELQAESKEGGGEEVGEEEEETATEVKVGEGPIKKVGKKIGKAIGGAVKMIPFVGGHQHGGKVEKGAGTGERLMAMNPEESITNAYDNTAISVPSNAAFNVNTKQETKKTAEKTTNENATMESLLKQLLKTNEEANKYLAKMAEPPEPEKTAPPTQMAKASTPNRSVGHTQQEIKYL
jgi:hypothetical protein